MIGINTGNLIKQIKKEKDFEDFIINKTSFLDSEKNTLAERLFYIRQNNGNVDIVENQSTISEKIFVVINVLINFMQMMRN